jgi:murein DD-endopeptidase MepM/ murein hydrolase activator NlpD
MDHNHDHDDETPEELAKREAQKRAAAITTGVPSENGIVSFFSGILDLFKKLFSAIFGSYTDSDSEYSLIDRERAKPNSWGENGRARAEALIDSIGNEKLRALATQYHGKTPTNISPFAVPATITSHLGHREVNVGSHDHKGIDMVPAMVSSNPIHIHNTMPGVVVRSETQYNKDGKMDGFGHWVEVACIDGTRRRYAHLAEKGVAVGTVLHQGEVIGIMGASGVGTGAHLHYEWRDASGGVIEPMIDTKVFARNDRSYRQSLVQPAEAKLYARNSANTDSMADAKNSGRRWWQTRATCFCFGKNRCWRRRSYSLIPPFPRQISCYDAASPIMSAPYDPTLFTPRNGCPVAARQPVSNLVRDRGACCR